MVESSDRSCGEEKLYSPEKRVLGVCVGRKERLTWPYLFRCVGEKTAGLVRVFS